jgi:hypothetical protein
LIEIKFIIGSLIEKKTQLNSFFLSFSYFCRMKILGKLIIGGAVDKEVLPKQI